MSCFSTSAALLLVSLTSSTTALRAHVPLADKYWMRVVKQAEQGLPRGDELPLTPSYVIFTLGFNLAAHLVASREAALALQVPPPTLFSDGLVANLGALSWGVPGAMAIAAIEVWRVPTLEPSNRS